MPTDGSLKPPYTASLLCTLTYLSYILVLPHVTDYTMGGDSETFLDEIKGGSTKVKVGKLVFMDVSNHLPHMTDIIWIIHG